MGQGARPTAEMPSTSSRAGLLRVTAAISRTGWSTPVEVSECCTSTPTIAGSAAKASATSCGSTALPQGTLTVTTSSPRETAISRQRWPNLPPSTTSTFSPGANRLYTAAVMAPVPEEVRGSTVPAVPKRVRKPSCTRPIMAINSLLRWWIMSLARARRTLSGRGVGPGVSKRGLLNMMSPVMRTNFAARISLSRPAG